MNIALTGILAAMMATNAPVAISNWIQQATGITIPVEDPNDPVVKELRRIMAEDDAAQEEADRWINENTAFKEKGAGFEDATLALKIEQRFASVRKAYEEFLKFHPDHGRARLAFGSFLNDIGRESEAKVQWEKAKEADPKNPAAWNNLANYYGHNGPVTNAFVHYAKALELDPRQPVYYRNLATTLFLFRQDAMSYLKIGEQEVFDHSLELYRQALKLDPTNFLFAADLAQTYYGIKPSRDKEALAAWNVALRLAHDEVEREGIYLHLARWELIRGNIEGARSQLAQVKQPMYNELKRVLTRNLQEKEKGAAASTNTPAVKP